METNAKETYILLNSIIGSCSLAMFTLTEPDFIRGILLPNSPTPSQMRTGEIWEMQWVGLWKAVAQSVHFSLYHDCRVHVTVQDNFCAAAHAKFLPKLSLFSSSSDSFTVSCCLLCFWLCGRHAPVIS